MNYLAHFHLAGDDAAHITGGLLGDYIKGPLKGDLPPRVEQGIILHRRIDQFTDEALNQSKLHEHFAPALRRYMGIVCDLYFDHLLAIAWDQFDQRSLHEYNSFVVKQLQQHSQLLPDNAQQFSARLQEHNILTLYQDNQMMAQIFERTGKRLKRDNPIAEAWTLLQQEHALLKEYFETFYPLLHHFAKQTRRSFAQAET